MSDQCKTILPNNDINKLLYKCCSNEFRKEYVEIGKDKVVMPSRYLKIADDIENFDVRDTDVWIVTFPKSGTTWCSEMIWMILNNVDLEKGKQYLSERVTFLEGECLHDYETVKEKYPEYVIPETVKRTVNDRRVPRLVKTHLPWNLLPKSIREGTVNPKIIYVARNPKDTFISFYHHHRLIDDYRGTLQEFCALFLQDRVYYSPYWALMDFWERRNSPNILYLTFEEMKKDMRSVIEKSSDFLIGKQFSDEKLNILLEHLKFENMKNNPSVNMEDILEKFHFTFMKKGDPDGKFIRAGKVGGYKEEMSKDMEELFDKWTEKHIKTKNVKF